MYTKFTIKDARSLSHFVEVAVNRINEDSRVLHTLRDQVIDLVKFVNQKDLLINQVHHVPGIRRWCSDALNDMIPAITAERGAYCQAMGGSRIGLSSRDIRAVHAIILYRILVNSDLSVSFARKVNIWPEAMDAWKQLQDYLRHKARSREAVNKLMGAIDIPQIVQPGISASGVGYTGAPATPLPQEYRPAILPFADVKIEAPALTDSEIRLARFQDYRKLQDELGDKLVEALNKPRISTQELNAVREAQQALRQDMMLSAYGGRRTIRPPFDHPFPSFNLDGVHPSPEALMQTLHNKGNETMSLGINVSPFNFNKPAIEEIKFVYGISVKELTLDRVTNLLTDRQAEVDRLKALPHKPEVIKNKIRVLKDEIASILALANELFPVAE